MNVSLASELQNILDKHFDFKSSKLSWENFNSDWSTAIASHLKCISGQEKALLDRVHEELEDILIHIPSKGALSEDLDWKKWTAEDDFLRFAISKEALSLPLSPNDFENIQKNALKKGHFKRPYSVNPDFFNQARKYIEESIAAKT